MKTRLFRFGVVMVMLVSMLTVSSVNTTYASSPSFTPTLVPLTQGGTTSFIGGGSPADPVVDIAEIDQATNGDTDSGDVPDFGGGVNRPLPGTVPGNGPSTNSAQKAKSNPELGTHFQGLNFFDQRFANGGNQFSVEPPDQGLCVGNGFVLEVVNDVAQVYDTSGTPLINGGAVDLNTFYGYAAAINRSTGARGPTVTDPSCIYDQPTNRFFMVVLTLDHVGTAANLSGTNHLDIAVTTTGDPTGPWALYRLPVQNNGTQGTPDHGCSLGFCLGDYPHIGADANAIYLTTNEFSVFGPGFYGAQIYAISKQALVLGAASPNVVLWNGGDPNIPAPAFTVWPANSPAGQYATSNGGTEYLLSSDAVFFNSGTSTEIWKWSITNTSAIDSSPLSLALSVSALPVKQYAVPFSRVAQKPGATPLRDCIADPTCAPLIGSTTANFAAPRSVAVNDSRMQQVIYANGKLWGALDTDVLQGSTHASAIAYFVFNPVSNVIFANGTLSLSNASLTYPAVAVTSSGRGVIAFTVVGLNDYPSAGYAGLDAKIGAGAVHIAAAGAGPWDSFTGYPTFTNRPRWGDYGAAASDGQSIWTASEYVAQTCTYAQYLTSPLGQCGGTRAPLGNWSTHISKITP